MNSPHIDSSQPEKNHVMASSETITLYHGSKAGIQGTIAPTSRIHCDFGRGFYMETDKIQPLTLICNYPNAKIYTVSVDLSNLKIFDIEVVLDWAMLVAYNRGKMEAVKNSAIYNKYADLCKDFDMVIGYIANDRMFVVLDRFFNGEITDLALINSLSALKLGRQYVALTEKACKNIEILDVQEISENDRAKIKRESEANRSKGISLADEICKKYRREGLFFDEILKAGKKNENFNTTTASAL